MGQIISFDDHVNSMASDYTGIVDVKGRPIKKAGDSFYVDQPGVEGKVIATAPSERIEARGVDKVIGRIFPKQETVDTGILDINENPILKDNAHYHINNNGKRENISEVNYKPTNSNLKQAATVALIVTGGVLLANNSSAAPFDVTTQFSLNDFGYDTAGGDTTNFFHTFSGIEERDADGNLTSTIGNPENIYGLAFSGGNLYAGNTAGDKIYGWNGSIWDLGLGTPLTNARGLAASTDNFFWLYNDGSDLGVLDKSGTLQSTIDVSGILGSGFGLGYNPNDNSLLASNGTDNIYQLFLNDTLTGFDSTAVNTVSGLGAGRGVGYNFPNNQIVANDSFDRGLYLEGPDIPVVPEPISSILFITGGALLGARRLFNSPKD